MGIVIRDLFLLMTLVVFAFPAFAQGHAELRRQLALLRPEAVRLALDDMAARWPQTCGKADLAWCAARGERRDALLKRHIDQIDFPFLRRLAA